MSAFDDEVRQGTREIYQEAGTLASVTPVAKPTINDVQVILDRSANVTDDYGIVLEARCEVGLLMEDVGDVGRGTLVDTGQPNDRWQLLEPIGNDGFETRWTAGRV
ncbi:hypothetical protein [Halomonas cerina]|uniref:Uncharacterized protein n=1 Tax=Halomonas cerina TaxID=447424 RepID=A0A839VDL1_9GAMM|nr:hypothetical protein [Halomonas cerina]MBB3192050.1 hypothetical protein [Halomonas cerina]